MSANEPVRREIESGASAPASRVFLVSERGAEERRRRAVRLHALEWPSLAPRVLLLLHGGGAHAHWWDHVAPAFRRTHRVFALDFRGHGDSEHTPGRYAPDVLTEDVEAVIDALGGTADVAGASMGGVVGLRVASRSDRIHRLVVVDSPPEPPANVVENRAMLSRPKRYASREEGLRRFRLMPPETTARPELLRHVAAHSLRPTADGSWTLKYDPTLFVMNPPRPLYEILPRVGCRVLYLRGERSALVSEELAERVAALLPDAQTGTIPGAYHHPFLDAPEAFVTAVAAFLSGGDDR